MINRLIEWSLRNRLLVFCGLALLIGFGVRAVYRTPVDAIPDLSENQVMVYADWPGRSPQEVEDRGENGPGQLDVRFLTGHVDFRRQN